MIENSNKFHKMWSVRFAALAAVASAMEISLPLWQGAVPPNVFAGIATASAVASAVARVIKQHNLE